MQTADPVPYNKGIPILGYSLQGNMLLARCSFMR